MELIDFNKGGCNNCCDNKTRIEACSDGNPVIIYLIDGATDPSILYAELATGNISPIPPPNLLIGNCTNIANSEPQTEVVQGSGSPISGSSAPSDSKLYFDVVSQKITKANINGFWQDVKTDGLSVLHSIQPTPLMSGNTTNLNTVFKDPDQSIWVVDGNGNALQVSTQVVLDGNNYQLPRGNAVTGVAPTLAEVPSPSMNDTATVFLNNGTTEYWYHDATSWILATTVLPVNTTNKFRTVQSLVAGDNTITHNLNLTNTPVIVAIEDATTGEFISFRKLPAGETANSTVISVSSAITNAIITIIG